MAKECGFRRGDKVALVDLDNTTVLTEGKRFGEASEKALRRWLELPAYRHLFPKGIYTGFPKFLEKTNRSLPGYTHEEDVLRQYLQKQFKRLPGGKAETLSKIIAPDAYKTLVEERNRLSEMPARIPRIMAVLKAKGYHRFLYTMRDPAQAEEIMDASGLKWHLHGAIFAAPMPAGKHEVCGLCAIGLNRKKKETLADVKAHFGNNVVVIDNSKETVDEARRLGMAAHHVESESPESYQKLLNFVKRLK
jgi:FMN phosphatase YigB (HAD superfamily)